MDEHHASNWITTSPSTIPSAARLEAMLLDVLFFKANFLLAVAVSDLRVSPTTPVADPLLLICSVPRVRVPSVAAAMSESEKELLPGAVLSLTDVMDASQEKSLAYLLADV